MTLPGERLRPFAARVCSPETMDRLIDPFITDLQIEYCEAEHHHSCWPRTRALIAGYVAFTKVLIIATVADGWRSLTKWKPDEAFALRRSSAVFTAVLVVATMVLAWLEAYRYFDEPVDAMRLTLYAVPSTLPLTIAFAAVLSVMFALTGARLTRRFGAIVLAMSFAASLATFANVAWLLPDSNQAFRETVFRAAETRLGRENAPAVARGNNEMSLCELRRQMIVRPAEARRLAFTYHTRWSLSFAPIALTAVALFFVLTVSRRTPRVFAGFAVCVFYYVALLGSRRLFDLDAPIILAAYLPNLLCIVAIGLQFPVFVGKLTTNTNR